MGFLGIRNPGWMVYFEGLRLVLSQPSPAQLLTSFGIWVEMNITRFNPMAYHLAFAKLILGPINNRCMLWPIKGIFSLCWKISKSIIGIRKKACYLMVPWKKKGLKMGIWGIMNLIQTVYRSILLYMIENPFRPEG